MTSFLRLPTMVPCTDASGDTGSPFVLAEPWTHSVKYEARERIFLSQSHISLTNLPCLPSCIVFLTIACILLFSTPQSTSWPTHTLQEILIQICITFPQSVALSGSAPVTLTSRSRKLSTRTRNLWIGRRVRHRCALGCCSLTVDLNREDYIRLHNHGRYWCTALQDGRTRGRPSWRSHEPSDKTLQCRISPHRGFPFQVQDRS